MKRRKFTYSRLRAKKEKELKKRLFIVLVMFTSIVSFIFLYGLNYFPSWVEFITNLVSTNDTSSLSNQEILLPPQIDPLPEYINTPKPEITGSALAGKTVKLFLDGNLIGETLSDKNGRFSFVPKNSIADGVHKLTALVVSGSNESKLSWPVTFVVDTKEPELVIESPTKDNKIKVDFDQQPFIVVKGQSESGVKVVVNNRLAPVKMDGSFSVKVPVEKEGNFIITAVATDKAGNTTHVELKVEVVKVEE